jgi:hypothetical protein
MIKDWLTLIYVTAMKFRDTASKNKELIYSSLDSIICYPGLLVFSRQSALRSLKCGAFLA